MGPDTGESPQTELTVVVPCFNVAETLPEQLDALMDQEWPDGSWDILVVDNGSTDETAAIAKSYQGRGVPLTILSATDGQSVAYARNAGIAAASARSIAICDGDDVVQPGWVATFGTALREHPFVGGVVDPTLVNESWLSKIRPVGDAGRLPQFGGEPFASGGNCGMHRSLWKRLGGYDEEFRGLEDIEFSLRARAIGVTPHLAEGAVIGYRYRVGLAEQWRQGIFYGRGRRELSARARSLGLQGASSVAALKSWVWLGVNLPKLATRSGRYAWVWVLANRCGAIVGLFDGSQADRRPIPADLAFSADRGEPVSRYHGVLITYRRHHDLRMTLDKLASQTHRLDTLVVVDNDNDSAVAEIVASASGAAHTIHYLATDENMGPAGGIHAGVAHVLDRADDNDWVVLLDDDDPPARDDCFDALQGLLTQVGRLDPRCAGIGLWGSTLNRRTGRLRAATGTAPEPVTYLPGGACPHYSVRALRVTGAPDPELFFGLDDLDFGLRFRDQGLRLYSSGLARSHELAHMVEGRKVSVRSEPPTWRRYYSLRNLIAVLRAHGETTGALSMSALAGVAKPLANLLRDPAVARANLTLNARALRDGWLGRLGKTIDPADTSTGSHAEGDAS